MLPEKDTSTAPAWASQVPAFDEAVYLRDEGSQETAKSISFHNDVPNIQMNLLKHIQDVSAQAADESAPVILPDSFVAPIKVAANDTLQSNPNNAKVVARMKKDQETVAKSRLPKQEPAKPPAPDPKSPVPTSNSAAPVWKPNA